jgi:hypothetical protein
MMEAKEDVDARNLAMTDNLGLSARARFGPSTAMARTTETLHLLDTSLQRSHSMMIAHDCWGPFNDTPQWQVLQSLALSRDFGLLQLRVAALKLSWTQST